ncbi:hypothetical protein H4R26_002437 [Coemansia thaxteri]|uniref:Uncharacterized protein n=1 Tax=Coemansia thaxteri TaxID=2663907 RepID=A0A9W8BKJ9_9FUNG|nr:hypothetical protein H4R26_002437 [Coemansia thaxteri]
MAKIMHIKALSQIVLVSLAAMSGALAQDSNTDAIVFAPDTGANADPGIVTILGDSDDDNYSCTITVDVTVTGSTLPYCDESSLWLSDIGDLDSDSGIDSSSATTSSKKSACPPSHFMAGLYTAAFAAALAVANVALF